MRCATPVQPIAGGAPVVLSTNERVDGFEISPDGTTVVYRSDQDVSSITELYSIPIGGGANPKLNSATPAG